MDEHRPIDKPGMRRMLFCLRIVRDASLRMSRPPSPKRASLVCLSIVIAGMARTLLASRRHSTSARDDPLDA